ncbi:MAG: hypothetical protein CM1200mP16_17130 [Nitrospina sp.]|nr:MAG: hypothetical protein CM1200mP16_17130 [Nitrospina sp.]
MSALGPYGFRFYSETGKKVVEVPRGSLKEIKNFCKEGPTAKELAILKKRFFFRF